MLNSPPLPTIPEYLSQHENCGLTELKQTIFEHFRDLKPTILGAFQALKPTILGAFQGPKNNHIGAVQGPRITHALQVRTEPSYRSIEDLKNCGSHYKQAQTSKSGRFPFLVSFTHFKINPLPFNSSKKSLFSAKINKN